MSKDFTGNYKKCKRSVEIRLFYMTEKMQDILKKWCGKFQGEMNNNIMEIIPTLV